MTHSKTNVNWTNFYMMWINHIYSGKINKLIEEYNELVESIKKGSTTTKSKEEKKEIYLRLKEIREEVNRRIQINNNGERKNVLKSSNIWDDKMWSWQDSKVYPFSNNKHYVYKEANKISTPQTFNYLRNKYLILKKYLWDLIPKSYFVFWESLDEVTKKRWIKEWWYCLSEKVITIQRRINWQDISKMSDKEKQDKDFLNSLEIAHRKYVLLKLFLGSILWKQWLWDKTMDLQLDIWVLSNKDGFSQDDLNFIKSIKSPNIMWDWNNISFIDFWFGTWDSDKQKVFDIMMQESTYQRWLKILEEYNLNGNSPSVSSFPTQLVLF